MPDITSRQHAVVRAFRAAARRDGAEALIDGWHLLREAADAGLVITIVAVSGEPPTPADVELLARLAGGSDVRSVSGSVMGAMSPVRTPSGVAALVQPREMALADVLAPEPPLVVVAVDVQDPGNVGAIVRAAEAGGATGVVAAGACAHPWGWKALRAAMGSTFRVPVVVAADPGTICDELREAGVRLVAADMRGGVSMYDVDWRPAAALLLGGEGAGLPRSLAMRADTRASIPMCPPVESLNVAVAAGLLVYEARRQRTCQT